MGMKILIEHGKLFGNDSPYMINVIAINQDNKNYCDAVSVMPFLNKLSKDELDFLFHTISNNIDVVSKGTMSSRGIEYCEPLSKLIREKYKQYF